jgi:hypothetical protein
MIEMHEPQPDHAEFDAICADVQEYEPLPEVVPGIAHEPPIDGDELDAEILAGLVLP